MTGFPRACIFYKGFWRPWLAIYSRVFIYWSSPSSSHSLKAMHQTDLLSRHRVRPPLCLTPLINRWPVWESGLWPCHSPARLIGFHLSLQSKGSDYKQINTGVGQVVLAHRHALPLCDSRGDWECVKVVGLERKAQFEGQCVYCCVAARMMKVRQARLDYRFLFLRLSSAFEKYNLEKI